MIHDILLSILFRVGSLAVQSYWQWGNRIHYIHKHNTVKSTNHFVLKCDIPHAIQYECVFCDVVTHDVVTSLMQCSDPTGARIIWSSNISHHSCWWHGPLFCQPISSNPSDFIMPIFLSPLGIISTVSIKIWFKHRYIFMFPEMNPVCWNLD